MSRSFSSSQPQRTWEGRSVGLAARNTENFWSTLFCKAILWEGSRAEISTAPLSPLYFQFPPPIPLQVCPTHCPTVRPPAKVGQSDESRQLLCWSTRPHSPSSPCLHLQVQLADSTFQPGWDRALPSGGPPACWGKWSEEGQSLLAWRSSWQWGWVGWAGSSHSPANINKVDQVSQQPLLTCSVTGWEFLNLRPQLCKRVHVTVDGGELGKMMGSKAELLIQTLPLSAVVIVLPRGNFLVLGKNPDAVGCQIHLASSMLS